MTKIFIHSTGTSPELWRWAGAGIIPANVGYPPNPPLPRGAAFTVDDEVKHLRALLPEGPVDLCAHSYGGLVALTLARELGARVRSFFLVEPVLFGALSQADALDPAAAAEARMFRDHPWFLTDAERGGENEWQEVFIDYWNRPGSWARLPEDKRAFSLSVGWKMFQEVRACFFDRTRFESWKVSQPMTLVVGERSPAASKAMVRGLAAINPQAQVVTLPGIGHMGLLTKPEQFVEPLGAHFARI